uniref:Uncharacterized protein n=1 Tax=Anguilla anguilla TaxID=7936 RepID=A0A0E9TU48_ANGAN
MKRCIYKRQNYPEYTIKSRVSTKITRNFQSQELLYQELKGSFSQWLSAFPPGSKVPRRLGKLAH